MKTEVDLISVGYHKGEVDFSVNSAIANLTIEELKKIRETIVVAIWCAEDMWQKAHPIPRLGHQLKKKEIQHETHR